MSFRQIFDRLSRIARANTLGWNAGDRRESLREAERLIEESRRRERGEQQEHEPFGASRTEQEENRDAAIEWAYRAIGVSRGATMGEITKAYRVRIVAVHPDRMVGATAEQIEEAKRRTQELNDAYTHLKRAHSGASQS